MFQSWRFKLRKAEKTLRDGRLDEACELLLEGDLTEFLPGKRLAARIAAQIRARARQHADSSDWQAAWDDLDKALSLGGETTELVELRRELVEGSLSAVRNRLAVGTAAPALELLDKLGRRPIPPAKLDLLRQICKGVASADKLARCGKFIDAETQLANAQELAPEFPFLKQRRDEVRQLRIESRPLNEQLHRQLVAKDWAAALATADQLLELAPECRVAKNARRQAWSEVGSRYGDLVDPGATIPWRPSVHRSDDGCDSSQPQEPRYTLWVDGVGGYLVCLSDEITLGQARPGTTVDVPIMADLSRKHAVIRRGGEGYWVEPLHLVRVNGRAAQAKTMLNDGDELELGSGVRIRFRRPHALSASARLEFISPHRTQPSADGVLLMAESCVLGPNWRNHVVCRDWSGDVVLYRHEDNLHCRAMESIEIDGELCDGRGRLTGNSHVVGSDFSMSLEELDRCSTQSLL